MAVKIVIVEDCRLTREGLRALLQKNGDYEVAGEADNGEDAIELVRTTQPGIVLMDVSMPGQGGVAATRAIRQSAPNAKIIGLSAHTSRRHVGAMIEAGASAYVLKTCAFEELLKAIESVLSGQCYLSPEITGIVMEGHNSGTAKLANGAPRRLSDRETQVLQMIAEGKSTKQIATDLHLSVKTIETHRRNLMEKLKLFSVAELTKHAIREGLTEI